MGRRMLITSTDLMMIQFLVPHVINLAEHGYEVEIACSEVGGRMDEIREKLKGYVKRIHTVRLVRSPASFSNFKGYRDMKRVIHSGAYDIIWTNEPVMGVVTRLAARQARKRGTKVLYMVHGFHFYKGAPVWNWLVYYPIESFASRFCDEIVTINREDYKRAKRLHSPEVKYIHGIGVDTTILNQKTIHTDIRRQLGLQDSDFIVLSVGELNKNKNHKVIIKAISQIHDKNVKYILCGKGAQQKSLEKLAKKCKVSSQIFFLGYRKDVADICQQSDIFAFPSYREGLGLASLEAMYSGLPLVASAIRGVEDYAENGKAGFLCSPDDSQAFAKAILYLKKDEKLRLKCSENNRKAAVLYCLDNVKKEVMSLFEQEMKS